MIPSDEQSPSELVVSGDGETREARKAAPRTHRAELVSGSGEAVDLEQYAATEAAKHLDAALRTLTEVMDNPNRNAQVRLMAAREVINLALRRNPEQSGGQSSRVYVLDRASAAKTLARRLGLPE
jgi:hypothetical protein